MVNTKKRHVYKVVFLSEGKIWEIYARAVASSSLLGFVEVEGLLFGQRSTVVVDPTEEKLRNEFAGVERTHLPVHTIVRIDRVEKRGTARITALPGGAEAEKVRPLPSPLVAPGKKER